jgi:hypothetical protein
LIENDNILSSLILKLPIIDLSEKVAISERLLWAHRFDLSSVIDVIESLLDGQLSDLFFRDDLTCEGKDAIYTRARVLGSKFRRNSFRLRARNNIAGTGILTETSISFRSFPEFFRSLMLSN